MKTGRPKSNTPHTKSSVYIKAEDWQKIGEIADKNNATKNAIIREAVTFYLDQTT
jgi:predicted transcriptional regulator